MTTTTTRPNPYTPATSALPPILVTGRLDRLRAAFDQHEVDALVVTTLPNIRYLTGFSGSAGVLAVTRGGALLTTDGRYRTQSAEQLDGAGAAAQVDIAIGPVSAQRQAAQDLLRAETRIGLEAGNVTWSGQRVWAELLDADHLVATTNMVEALREVKDPAEIARMERAAAIADAALFEVLPLMGQGVTEEHFALVIPAQNRAGRSGCAQYPTPLVGRRVLICRLAEFVERREDRTELDLELRDLLILDMNVLFDCRQEARQGRADRVEASRQTFGREETAVIG